MSEPPSGPPPGLSQLLQTFIPLLEGNGPFSSPNNILPLS